jgi:hypothetical protein
VDAFEGMFLNHLAGAVIDFRDDWLDTRMTNEEGLHGRVVLQPFVFVSVARAFGHQTLKETENYLTAVAKSAGVLDLGLKLKARIYSKPALDPRIAAQYGNAYELFLARK